jgi:DNA-3-methyladenine glycosylase II
MVSEATNFANICYQLHSRDKKLAKIIDSVGPCTLVNGHAGFDFLVDAIIGQQISKQAAATIIQRFRRLFSSGRATASKFLGLPREKVLKAGLSKRKYDYIRDLARKIEDKQLRLSRLEEENNATVRQVLKKVKGIGDWTVDMYLLFGLARLDVFPTHDLALRKIMCKVYGFDSNDMEEAKKIAEKWKPYRSVASWYLYKFGG